MTPDQIKAEIQLIDWRLSVYRHFPQAVAALTAERASLELQLEGAL